MDATSLLVTLVLANWAFTGGAYAFAWRLYMKLTTNHIKHLEDRVKHLEENQPP